MGGLGVFFMFLGDFWGFWVVVLCFLLGFLYLVVLLDVREILSIS